MWLGIGTLAHPSAPQAATEQATDSWARQAAKGAGVSGLNPKVFLLFLALLPQFTDPDADWPLAVQIAVLGLLHVANCTVVYTGVGTGAQLVLRLGRSSTGGEPLLRRRNDRDRCGAPGREAARLDMDFGGVSRDVAGRHSMSSNTSNETAPYCRGEDDEPIYNDYRAMRLAAIPRRAMEDETQREQASPEIQARIRASFERQGLMRHLGARLGHVGPGFVKIVLPSRPEVTQQHGYIHAGATSAIADSAGGYAALTLFPDNTAVLTVEYKINLLAPAVAITSRP